MRYLPASDGVSLAVHEHGGHGRPTLFCHATGLHGAVWEPLSAALDPELERWAVDFRGHGASVVPPDHPLPWSAFRDDVLGRRGRPRARARDLPRGRALARAVPRS